MEIVCFLFTGVWEKVQFRETRWAYSAIYEFTATCFCTDWPGKSQTTTYVVAVSCQGALAATLALHLQDYP
jgi:hypothetical protein